jgi:hypothetical protein
LIGSVVRDVAPPEVNRVLHAAARPRESNQTSRHRGTASVLALPARVLGVAARPHRTTGAPSAVGGLDRVLGEVTSPLRLTGGPATSPIEPVTAPLSNLLPRPVAVSPKPAAPAAVSSKPAVPATDSPSSVSSSSVNPATITPAVQVAPVDKTELSPVEIPAHRVAHASTAVRTVARRHSAPSVAESDTVRENQPGGDGPAPLQVHLGAVSGIPAGGSGTPTEGGSAAVLPAAVAAGTMAPHRLPIATDIEVRRNDAEAPIVSPD